MPMRLASVETNKAVADLPTRGGAAIRNGSMYGCGAYS